MQAAEFEFHPDFRPALLQGPYRRSMRLHIPDFLIEENARRLSLALETATDWTLVFNRGDKIIELEEQHQLDLTNEQRRVIDLAVNEGGRHGFQFKYHTMRVQDSASERKLDPGMLSRFAKFLGSETVLSAIRTITGLEDIGWADAQATRFGPGDFLTLHDDEVASKNRRAAYVVNLSPSWKADWGGLLMFHGADGHVDEALTPAFNALNLFTIPQPHSVSVVAPFAPDHRYSITGWFRAGAAPI